MTIITDIESDEKYSNKFINAGNLPLLKIKIYFYREILRLLITKKIKNKLLSEEKFLIIKNQNMSF